MKPLLLSLIVSFFATSLVPAHANHVALARFPQAYGDNIVFVAEGNLWTVSRQGGVARELTHAPGQAMLPRVSPDGHWIAFTQTSKGGSDVWVMPTAGGSPRKLTTPPAVAPGTGGGMGPDNMVVTWTPDSKRIVYLTKAYQWNDWIRNMYAVPVVGGLPQPMPIDDAVGLATYSPDGRSIAYNRIFSNFRTWKRYNGGLAQQIFTYDLQTRSVSQITQWSGTNTSPMWYRDKVYYLSDQSADRRVNLWSRDVRSGQVHQVTHVADFDIDFPALGEEAITFQQGGKLYLLSLPDEKLREISFTLPGENAHTRPHDATVQADIREKDARDELDYALSPDGGTALFSARGDLFAVPTKAGDTRNLTTSPGVDEDHPVWSQDGRWIAYTTDRKGEQQIALRPAPGGEERILTHFKTGYRYRPTFSADARTIAFSDSDHRLWVMDVADGKPRFVAQDKQQEILDEAFSPDGRWLAFSMTATPGRSDLYLFELSSGHTTKIGPGQSTDANPTWSPDGKYLFFTSRRHENFASSDEENDFALVDSTGIYAIALSRDTPSPMTPTAPATGALQVDLDGMMDRAVVLPVKPSTISQIQTRGHCIYFLAQSSGASADSQDDLPDLHCFDLTLRQERVIALHVSSFSASADGSVVLVKHDKQGYAVIASSATKGDPATIDLGGLRMRIDPRAEWSEMFENAWRLARDLFVSKAMNGQDWEGVHRRYVRLLPLLGSRDDLNWLIGQVLGEIGTSHSYVGGGDMGDDTPKRPQPIRLGVDWALDAASGRYTLATIYPGDNTREPYRSPLHQPGLDIHAGDVVLAIDGKELRDPETPDTLLQEAKPGERVRLTVSDRPDGKRRDVSVEPVASELNLREAARIGHNRQVVDRMSGGRVGYIYLSDMGNLGLSQFTRQYYSQLDKQAMVIDDRWNLGGSIASYILERLRRKLVAATVYREGAVETQPERLLNGPKVVLLNHWSASNGDLFPYLFKQYGLGPLVGTRSWGGLRGYKTRWPLLDGGYITIPERAVYNLDSTWAVENHGVDPDVEVENQPADLLAGHDAQLETAVSLMLKAIAVDHPAIPSPPPLLPAYPASGIVVPWTETPGATR